MKAKAPRLEAYLEYGLDTTVLIVSRNQWESLQISNNEPIEVNIQACPISKVSQNATKLAVIANRVYPSVAEVSLYRHDPKDYPKDWNLDKYMVEENLSSRSDLAELISKASTSYNDNMEQYIDENVFWIKKEPDADHHLQFEELPAVVKAIIKRD